MKRYGALALVIFVGLGPILFFDWVHAGLAAAAVTVTRPMFPLEQSAQVLAGLGIKPLYSLISLAAILFLAGQTARDLAALRWGLIAFISGETFCAINFWIFRHESLVSEYLHSYGMVLAFGLMAFAVFDGLDARVLKLGAPGSRCMLAGSLCAACMRSTPAACAARRGAQVVLGMSAVLVFIPLVSALTPHAYATSLYGFPYTYTRFEFYEWYEQRVLPWIALACFGLAWLPLLRKTAAPLPTGSKALFSAGLGALGFSVFRLALGSIFSENLVWFEFWEEATELMLILAIAYFLWQFRSILEKTAIVRWLEG